jgi:hypothetical protein
LSLFPAYFDLAVLPNRWVMPSGDPSAGSQLRRD